MNDRGARSGVLDTAFFSSRKKQKKQELWPDELLKHPKQRLVRYQISPLQAANSMERQRPCFL